MFLSGSEGDLCTIPNHHGVYPWPILFVIASREAARRPRGFQNLWIYPCGARRLMRRYHGFVGACPELAEGLLAKTDYSKLSQ